MNAFEATLREVLASGHHARFRAAGDSMYPAIRDGDTVEIAPCDPATLLPGDIVLAATARGLTMHRIVRISNVHIVIRGDNALLPDAPVIPENIIGRMAEGKPIRNDWLLRRKSVKIIRFAAPFIRRLRFWFRQALQK